VNHERQTIAEPVLTPVI